MTEFRRTYDWEGDGSLARTVVETVAAATGREPADLDALYGVVDPDALEAVFEPLDCDPSRAEEGRVEFAYEGCRVTVTAGGEVTVRPPGATRTDVTTDEAFQAALSRLVREAEANGVGVDGGWISRDGATDREWGIEIYEVRRSGESTAATSRE